MSANLKAACFAKSQDDVSGSSPYNSVDSPAASEAGEQNKQSREKKATVKVPPGVCRGVMQNGLTGELKRVKVKSGSDQACVEPLVCSSLASSRGTLLQSARRIDQNPFPRPLPRPLPHSIPPRDDDCCSKGCLLKRCCCIQ